MEHRRYERRNTMGMFKDAIVAKLAASRPITHELHLHLQNHLSQLIPSSKIPSHPPYAWMIRRAIMDLNEEGGSTEEAMSSSIRKEHDDLPYAHSSFLSHYLGVLVRNGELCLNGEKYCIPALVHGSEEKEAKNARRFKLRMRLRRRSGRTGCLKRKQRKDQKVNDRKRERLEGFMFFGEKNMGSVLEEDEEVKQLGDGKSNRDADADADGDRRNSQHDTGTACSITPFSIIMQTDGSSLPHSKGIRGEGLALRKREIGQKKSQIEETRISRGALSSLNLSAKGEERTGLVVEYGIKQKEVKGKRKLVCGLAANSTRQQSQTKTVDGWKNTTKLQTPASSYLSKCETTEIPKIAAPERLNQNQERPLKVYYRRKVRVASVYSSRQNQQKAGKIYHEENLMSYLPAAEGKESSRSTTMISGLEHKQQVSWAMQRQRTKGIRVAKCRIADKDKSRSKLGTIYL